MVRRAGWIPLMAVNHINLHMMKRRKEPGIK